MLRHLKHVKGTAVFERTCDRCGHTQRKEISYAEPYVPGSSFTGINRAMLTAAEAFEDSEAWEHRPKPGVAWPPLLCPACVKAIDAPWRSHAKGKK